MVLLDTPRLQAISSIVILFIPLRINIAAASLTMRSLTFMVCLLIFNGGEGIMKTFKTKIVFLFLILFKFLFHIVGCMGLPIVFTSFLFSQSVGLKQKSPVAYTTGD